MIRFDGTKELKLPLSVVFAKLTDARFLLECVPGVEAVAKSEPNLCVWTLRPGFSFVRGTLDVTMQVLEIISNESARLSLFSKGIGSSSDVEATLRFSPRDLEATVNWAVEVKTLGGLLKAVPQGLIKASAQKVIADVWMAIESKLSV